MQVAFSILKNDILIADDYEDAVYYKSTEIFQPIDKKVEFKEHTLLVPVNYEKVRIYYRNHLEKVYI